MKALLRPLQAFLRLEASSAILLFAGAVAALVWANVDPESYGLTFHQPLPLGSQDTWTLGRLIDDGPMTLFFFLVGLEIMRELTDGELASPAQAALPALAALGGMAAPAVVYLALNHGGAGERGWGVPVATDIAFAVGCLALVGPRLPRGLAVFLTALAIFDDLGGIVVIALFYGRGLHLAGLAAAAGLLIAVAYLSRRGVSPLLLFALAGPGLWLAFHAGGVHPTLAGVGLAVALAPRRGDHSVGLARLEVALHPAVAYGIVPIFALANAGVTFGRFGAGVWSEPVTLGCALGLFLGKQVGIFGATWLAAKSGLASMPGGATAAQVYGVSAVGGIGFTVALFIATLAFAGDPLRLEEARLGILAGSAAAGLWGWSVLRWATSA